MSNKPKTTQPETPNEVQGRDLFQTPDYAVDLLIPFIPLLHKNTSEIWECAAGEGKISKRLKYHGYRVLSTDIRGLELEEVVPENFLTDYKRTDVYRHPTVIITNPPFSSKYKFIFRAIEYGLPFAFLIPFDMCQKMAILFDTFDCQGIIPTSRINYITPSGKSEATGHSSYYHSFWITRYFNLEKQLTFVKLTKEMRQNI
jgi:hypothetical protein